MDQEQLETQKTAELEVPPGGTRPRRATRVRDDADAKCVIEMLAEIAARIPHVPAVKPPAEGMVRLGNRDRASYVWFLPCPAGLTDSRGEKIELCNHGIGVDRSYGAYEVRAWAHGSSGVHDLSLKTGEVTMELLETAAQLIGLPLAPPPPPLATATCPVCLQLDIAHDGAYLENHRTLAGFQCHGSGWNITNRLEVQG